MSKDNLLFIRVLIFLVPFYLGCFWTFKAHMRFLQLYKEKVRPKYPILPKDFHDYSKNPIKILAIYPMTTIRILNELLSSYTDTELSNSVTVARKRWLLLLLIFFFSFLATIIYSQIVGI